MAITIKIFERFSNLGLHSAAIVSGICEKALKRESYVPVQDFIKDGIKSEEIKIALQGLFASGIFVAVDNEGKPVPMPVIDTKTLDGIQIDNIICTVKLQEQIQSAMDLDEDSREAKELEEKKIGNATYRFMIVDQYDTDDNPTGKFLASIVRFNDEIVKGSQELVITRVRPLHEDVEFAHADVAWKWWDDIMALRTEGVIKDRINLDDGWVYGLRFKYPQDDFILEAVELVKFHETEAPEWHLVNSQEVDTEAQGYIWWEEQLDILWPANVEPPVAEVSTEARFAKLEHIEDEEEAKAEVKYAFDLKIGETAISVTIAEFAGERSNMVAEWYDPSNKHCSRSAVNDGHFKTEKAARTAAEKWLKEFIS